MRLGSRSATALALSIVAILALKTLLFSYLFSDSLVSDEIYYVTSAKYLLYKLGLLPRFVPPVNATYKVVNNTIFVNVSFNERVYGFNVLMGEYNWLNTEHPIAGKLIYAVIYLLTRSIVITRLVLLSVSLAILFVFFRYVISEYSVKAIIPLGIIALLDGTYYHFTYLLFLDTLMLDMLILGIYFLLKERYWYGVALIGAACAIKEVAIVFAVGVSLYLLLIKRRRFSLLTMAISLAALLAGYGAYLLFTSPQTVIGSFMGLGKILDPFACRDLCLFTIYYRWSIFGFYSFYLWIWFAGITLIALLEAIGRSVDHRNLLPYYVVLVYIVFLSLIQFRRAIYPYYFAPAVVLSVFPFKDVEEALLYVIKRYGFKIL